MRSWRSSRSIAAFQARAAFSGEACALGVSQQLLDSKGDSMGTLARDGFVRRVEGLNPLPLSYESTEGDGHGLAPMPDATTKNNVQAENHHGIQSPDL
jgi:hypothetical protein